MDQRILQPCKHSRRCIPVPQPQAGAQCGICPVESRGMPVECSGAPQDHRCHGMWCGHGKMQSAPCPDQSQSRYVCGVHSWALLTQRDAQEEGALSDSVSTSGGTGESELTVSGAKLGRVGGVDMPNAAMTAANQESRKNCKRSTVAQLHLLKLVPLRVVQLEEKEQPIPYNSGHMRK